jgi:hypothetical protein
MAPLRSGHEPSTANCIIHEETSFPASNLVLYRASTLEIANILDSPFIASFPFHRLPMHDQVSELFRFVIASSSLQGFIAHNVFIGNFLFKS